MDDLKNYCVNGNCSRCGNCCAALIPLTKKEEKDIKKYIQEKNIKPTEFILNKSINLQCCFYDRNNKICKIYDVRPKICRTFKCCKNTKQLELEKIKNHKRAYWNHIDKDGNKKLTDMRLLFYNDPRSFLGNIFYTITNGQMNITKEKYEFIKNYLIANGHIELVNSMTPIWGDDNDKSNGI